MIKLSKRFVRLSILLLFYIHLIGCNSFQFEDELIKIIASTSLLECEQDNIHLQILDAERADLIGEIILPICEEKQACEKEFYQLKDIPRFIFWKVICL